MKANSLNFLEAATRFELVNNGFADRSLTTWVCRPDACCLTEIARGVKEKFRKPHHQLSGRTGPEAPSGAAPIA